MQTYMYKACSAAGRAGLLEPPRNCVSVNNFSGRAGFANLLALLATHSSLKKSWLGPKHRGFSSTQPFAEEEKDSGNNSPAARTLPQSFQLVKALHDMQEKKRKTTLAEETLTASIMRGKKTLRRKESPSPPPPRSYKTENANGIWRLTGSTWFQKLAVRSVFNSAPSGNEFMSIFYRMPVGMKFMSKLSSTLVVSLKA
eukprot:scaffold163707_cov14-Tisochrysis_lutea.AAC.1